MPDPQLFEKSAGNRGRSAAIGLLPLPPLPTAARMPILLVHGKDDQTIPSMASGAAAGQLKAAGYDVTLDIEPGVGHTISMDGAQKALVFLKTKFAS